MRELPALQARESIVRINDFKFAFGSMSEQEREQYLAKLNAIAVGRTEEEAEKARVVRPASPEEMAQLMGGSGQRVIMS